MLEHVKGLTVGHLANAIGDGGHAIVKIRLPHSNIDRFMMFRAQAAASG